MAKFIDIKRKSLSLFQLDCIQLQSVVSSVTSWKHTVQAVPSKKKRRKKGKRWKREEEEKGMERVVRKERERGE